MKIIKILLVTLAVFIIVYLSIAFSNLTLDFRLWSYEERLTTLAISFFVFIILSSMIDGIQKS